MSSSEPSHLTNVASGPQILGAASADLDRIAVVRDLAKVALYSGTGRRLRVFTPSSVREVALRKDYLVVPTRSATLEIFNARTGGKVRTLPVAPGASRLDVHSGIAVYSTGRFVHALRLADGKDVVVATGKRAIVADAVEASGVAYAYNTFKGLEYVGNLGFLSLAKVNALLG